MKKTGGSIFFKKGVMAIYENHMPLDYKKYFTHLLN